MNESDVGTYCERALALKFLKFGFDVLYPEGEHKPYDFGIFKGNDFQRIQVKRGYNRRGIVTFNVTSSSGKWYTDTADVFGVYYEDEDRGFIIPVSKIEKCYGGIHINPPKRCRPGQLMAADYELNDQYNMRRAA